MVRKEINSRDTLRVSACTILILCLLLPTTRSLGQDLRFYVNQQDDTLNHSSTYEPFKQLMISDYQAEKGRKANTWLRDVFLNDNFLKLKKDNYLLTLDPLFENHLGKEINSGKNLLTNTRGVRFQGVITDTHNASVLEFSSTYFESQSLFSPYLDSIIKEHRVTPGQMDYRGSGIYQDHSYATAWLRYTPNDIFSFEAGNGKNFFGNGYRSMFLSDANMPYPYFRIDTRFWRIHYINMWAEFQDQTGWQGYGHAYQKKYGAFHYLSLAVTERLEINAFEVINWQGRDSTHHRNFELSYLNPIIFFRPVEWSIGSPDNALIGAGFSYRFLPKSHIYGQLLIDELSFSKLLDYKTGHASNKIAAQFGLKSHYEFRKSKIENRKSLFLQTELNLARPYTYSHISSKSNFGNMNFSLAHPLGANFIEWVNFVRLQWGRLSVEGRYSWAMFGSDEGDSNYGHNIFLPYDYDQELTGVHIGYGVKNTLTYAGLTTAFLINPYSNFNLFVSILNRTQKNEQMNRNDLIFQFGVRSSIRNLYYDF